MRIRGWRRAENSFGKPVDYKWWGGLGRGVRLIKSELFQKMYGKKWGVRLVWGGVGETLGKFKTRELAEKFSVEWMRKHPRG